MSLKPLHIICVGRPRAAFWNQAALHYLERLRHWRKVTDSLVRDADGALPPARRKVEEGRRILDALGKNDIVICLDEHGQAMTSPKFSQFLETMSSDLTRSPCFIVGGPFGLDRKVLDSAAHTISLGPQTLPHELARVVLLEQLYRAESIARGSPYHHNESNLRMQ